MSTAKSNEPTAIDAGDLEELQQACDDALRGIRRPAAMEAAARELEHAREEIRRRVGETALAERLTDRDNP